MSWPRSLLDERLALLPAIREHILAGLSQTEIAKAVGLGKNQVVGICHRQLRAEWLARPNPRPAALPGRVAPHRARLPGVASLEVLACLETPPVEVEAAMPEPEPEPVVAPSRAPAWVSMPVVPARSCQWPLEPWRRPWPMCGAACEPGRPYCAEHVARSYVGLTRRVAA